MKRYLKTIGFAVLVFLSISFYGHHIVYTFSYSSPMAFGEIVKKFFLEYHPDEKISFYVCLLYSTIFILALFSFLPYSFASLRSYRSLLMHRYEQKTRFLRHILQSNLVYTGAETIWIAFCVLIALKLQGLSYTPTNEIWTTLLLFANIFLYFNLCVLIKVFLCICSNEVYADMLTAFLTVLLIYVDSKITTFSILTWGSVHAALLGMIVQALVYLITLKKLVCFLNKEDVL